MRQLDHLLEGNELVWHGLLHGVDQDDESRLRLWRSDEALDARCVEIDVAVWLDEP